MKLLKKFGIGFLALIICVCSCFKFVNAYSFTNFVAPYTTPGSTYIQPLVNCNLSFVTYSSSNATHYLYPLTPYNYVGASNQTQEVNAYYDLQFNKQYSFILNSNTYTDTISRYINGEHKSLVYSYNDGNTHYYNIDYSGYNVNEIVVDFDYNLLYLRDVRSALATLYFPNNSNINGNYSIEFYYEYFENGQLTSTTYSFSYPLDTITDSTIIINPTIPNETLENDEYYDFILNVQPTRIRAKVTSDNIDLSLVNHIEFYTRYVNVVEYANIFGLVSQPSSIIIEQPTDDIDFTRWLSKSVGSFMNFEIFPNFKLGNMLGVIVSIPLLIYILKLFLGG